MPASFYTLDSRRHLHLRGIVRDAIKAAARARRRSPARRSVASITPISRSRCTFINHLSSLEVNVNVRLQLRLS